MTDKRDISFNEQAYLMWDHFVSSRKGTARGQKSDFAGKLKTSTTLHKITGKYNVNNFVSKMVSGQQSEIYRSLIDLETHKISALIPRVRLFKIKNDKYIPFHFPVSAENVTAATLLQPGASLGGAGITDFSVSFVGKDFFTRDKQLEISLSIYVDSLELLFRDNAAGYAPLAELFTISRERQGTLRESSSKEVQKEQVNKASSHEIGAILGYGINRTSSGNSFTSSDKGMGDMFSPRERQAIENSTISMRMTYNSHDISVGQDGQSRITIKYIGRLSGMLDNPMMNIMADQDEILSLSEIQSKISEQRQDTKVSDAKKKEKIEKLKATLKKSVRTRFRGVIEHLEDDYKVHVARVGDSALSQFNEYAGRDPIIIESSQSPPPVDKPSDDQTNPDNKVDDTLPTAHRSDEVVIQFVYIGDFIQAAILTTEENLKNQIAKISKDKIKTESQKKTLIQPIAEAIVDLSSFKILFGKVDLMVGDNTSVSVNLADIPVSLKTIASYLFDNIEQKHVSRLTLRMFLDDVVAMVYPMAIQSHTFRDARTLPKNVNIKSNHFTADKVKELNKQNESVDISQLPNFLKNSNQRRSKSDDSEYFIIYAEMSNQHPVGLRGNAKKDAKEGVYHFNFSKNRGLLKNISFSQNNVKYRKEALMMESVSLYDELKMPYNATITMFGNNLFLPGALIYVNPASLGMGDPRNKRSAAARIGLGGYYRVITVTTSYSNGAMETTLTTQHQSWADADSRMSTAEVLQETGVFNKALRIKERNGKQSPVKRLF